MLEEEVIEAEEAISKFGKNSVRLILLSTLMHTLAGTVRS